MRLVRWHISAGREQMRAAPTDTECEYRGMLEEPDLIRGECIALGGEALHRTPGGLIVDQPEMTHVRCGDPPCRWQDVCYGAHRTRRELSSPALLRLSACSAR